MSKILVYRPDLADEIMPTAAKARRRIPAGGFRITLLNNGKPKTVPLLSYLVEELGRHYPVASVSIVSKPSAAFTIDEGQARELSENTDLLISGLGDCGSCSACSLQDALALERLGVPAALVITDPFVDVCSRVAARMGYPGYIPVVVPHPVATRQDVWLRKTAILAAEAMMPLVVPAASAAAAS